MSRSLPSLPLRPPVEPMLAAAAVDLPTAGPGGAKLGYEPKWDGYPETLNCLG